VVIREPELVNASLSNKISQPRLTLALLQYLHESGHYPSNGEPFSFFFLYQITPTMEKDKKMPVKPEPTESQETVNWKVVGPLVAILLAAVLYVTLFL
jgi:hypothetical protein